MTRRAVSVIVVIAIPSSVPSCKGWNARAGTADKTGTGPLIQAPTRSRFARPVRAAWMVGPGRQFITRAAMRQPVPMSQTGPEHPRGNPDISSSGPTSIIPAGGGLGLATAAGSHPRAQAYGIRPGRYRLVGLPGRVTSSGTLQMGTSRPNQRTPTGTQAARMSPLAIEVGPEAPLLQR